MEDAIQAILPLGFSRDLIFLYHPTSSSSNDSCFRHSFNENPTSILYIELKVWKNFNFIFSYDCVLRNEFSLGCVCSQVYSRKESWTYIEEDGKRKKSFILFPITSCIKGILSLFLSLTSMILLKAWLMWLAFALSVSFLTLFLQIPFACLY